MPGKFIEGCNPEGTKFILAVSPSDGKIVYQTLKPESFEVVKPKK